MLPIASPHTRRLQGQERYYNNGNKNKGNSYLFEIQSVIKFLYLRYITLPRNSHQVLPPTRPNRRVAQERIGKLRLSSPKELYKVPTLLIDLMEPKE